MPLWTPMPGQCRAIAQGCLAYPDAAMTAHAPDRPNTRLTPAANTAQGGGLRLLRRATPAGKRPTRYVKPSAYGPSASLSESLCAAFRITKSRFFSVCYRPVPRRCQTGKAMYLNELRPATRALRPLPCLRQAAASAAADASLPGGAGRPESRARRRPPGGSPRQRPAVRIEIALAGPVEPSCAAAARRAPAARLCGCGGICAAAAGARCGRRAGTRRGCLRSCTGSSSRRPRPTLARRRSRLIGPRSSSCGPADRAGPRSAAGQRAGNPRPAACARRRFGGRRNERRLGMQGRRPPAPAAQARSA